MPSYYGCPAKWYKKLYLSCLKEHKKLSCRQGPCLELNEPVYIKIPPADNLQEGITLAAIPRRYPITQRLSFSVAHGVQKLIGLPDSYLSSKFPILKRYIREDEETTTQRINIYVREILSNKIPIEGEWIKTHDFDGINYSVIDQLHLAIFRLLNSEELSSRRAYIDFNEGFKPRCVSSWLFIVRSGRLDLHQSSRSTDLLVGMPNDLLGARTAQILLATALNLNIGVLYQNSSIVQTYSPDCAGIDGVSGYLNIASENDFEFELKKFLETSTLLHNIYDCASRDKINKHSISYDLNKLRNDLKIELDRFLGEESS